MTKQVTLEDIYSRGGSGLLVKYYGGSPSKALQIIYPDIKWKLWLFDQTPRQIFSRFQNAEYFDLIWFQKILGRRGERKGVHRMASRSTWNIENGRLGLRVWHGSKEIEGRLLNETMWGIL
jgi:hypothetical protein